ncbi:uncharacterized protein LOC129613410 [Condylostylus longicornis]|uniref:uncharacterized protein LOC129613410 n=1 Tax=Condylostylus longicornis TaxID=2530218 RepID=UPI00244E5B94|nr:uncharacterized protein LOC129613410 [Condylostylus longicornis]
MFLKVYMKIFIISFLIFYVKGIPLQDDLIHAHHGSLYENINYAHQIDNQPIIDNKFKNSNFLTTQLGSEENFGELHKQKSISPDTYNLDQVIPNLDASKLIGIANKYKADNLYTLALPKINYGRPRHYFVFRDNDETHHELQPHRFSNLAIKSHMNSNDEDDLSDLKHHEDLKNIVKSYPELFETVTLKNFLDQPKIKFIKPTFSNLDNGGKIFSRDVKNKFLRSTDVSHVKFSGMGTSYEF